MRFSIHAGRLAAELALAANVIEKKTKIPVLSGVLLRVEAGQLTLTATDLEMGFESVIEGAEDLAQGAIVLPADRLAAYLGALDKSSKLDVRVEKTSARLECGRNRARLEGLAIDNFPELPRTLAPPARIPVASLAGAFGWTIASVAKEESRYTLLGALVELEPGELRVTATDGHRLAHWRGDVDGLDVTESVKMIAAKSFMAKALDLARAREGKGEFEMGWDENHVQVSIGPYRVVHRKLTGQFPDYQRVLPATFEGAVSVEREALLAAVRRVASFSDDQSHALKVDALDDGVRLKAQRDGGEAEDLVPLAARGALGGAGYNARYLEDFLGMCGDAETVEWRIGDGESASELRPAGETDRRYVVMPLRV